MRSPSVLTVSGSSTPATCVLVVEWPLPVSPPALGTMVVAAAVVVTVSPSLSAAPWRQPQPSV